MYVPAQVDFAYFKFAKVDVREGILARTSAVGCCTLLSITPNKRPVISCSVEFKLYSLLTL